MRINVPVSAKGVAEGLMDMWGDSHDMRPHLMKMEDDVVSFVRDLLEALDEPALYALLMRALAAAAPADAWDELGAWEADA